MDSKSFTSHKKLLLEFIELYKSMPCLWDRQHRGYGIRKRRLEAYRNLVHKYQEIDPAATLPTVKSRLDIIRCGFIRELKKVRLSKEMTSVPSQQYKPRLWYYDSCTFLEDQYLPLKDTKTVKISESDEDAQLLQDEFDDSQAETEYLEEETSDCSSNRDNTLARKRRRVKLDTPAVTTSHHPRKRWEDLECIGKAIALQMRDLEPYQAAIAHKLISDTIFYARLGKLTLGAHVAVNVRKDAHSDKYS